MPISKSKKIQANLFSIYINTFNPAYHGQKDYESL